MTDERTASNPDSGLIELLPGVVWQSVDDGVMLLDVAKGQYFELNTSGARMFQLLLEQDSMETVQSLLLDEFEIDASSLQQDLGGLIGSLRAAGLITAGESP